MRHARVMQACSDLPGMEGRGRGVAALRSRRPRPHDRRGGLGRTSSAIATHDVHRDGHRKTTSSGWATRTPPNAAFVPYDHPDQKAVAAAMTTVDLGLPGPQWSRTYPSDPAKALSTSVVFPIRPFSLRSPASRTRSGRSGHESECAPGRRLTGRLRLAGISRRLLVRRRSAGSTRSIRGRKISLKSY